ncbi:MAG: bifunctional 3-demethylubiquinol 3-O-methyltransferase/2-polyprenyl-6-hydroxyphenol methylase, partial [Alphaproteobacteria bacterium]|nr:bifunctional 3-demethylubiquinol 3-O-methyltransferase/2-polyprenyl-6-hydroxyphenol methylase [Alphaproteobacteria bacterium]
STLNRTAKSFALGIVAAEYILRWLPRGTHDWRKFMKPSDMAELLEDNGFKVTDVRGLVYNPLTEKFSLSRDDLTVNYLLTAVRA